MKNKYLIGIIFITMGITTFYYAQKREGDRKVILTLFDIEKPVHAEDINYHVPDKSNNPKECTMEIWVSGSIGEGGAGGYFKKVKGIVNVCTNGSSGCDPYNCHQRI